MRKRITAVTASPNNSIAGEWLDLVALAQVELTSEDARFPIENALAAHPAGNSNHGWHAAGNGPQTIQVNFDQPQLISRIVLRFVDKEHERTQEFALHVKTYTGARQELVRQQWSFSPGGSTEEVEDYTVSQSGVVSIELTIDPDRGRDRYPATLAELKIG